MAVTTTNDPLDVVASTGRSWGWVMGFGIITIIVGIIITIRPKHTVHFFAVVFGVWLFVGGLYYIVKAIAHRGETGGERFALALIGLLSVLVGLLVLHHTFQTVAVIGFIVGIFWVIAGLSQLFAGFDSPPGERALQITIGVLGTIVGIITLLIPGLSLTIIAVLMGIWLILFGILQIIVAVQLRKLAHPS